MIEAEEPVRVVRRRCAVIEAAERQPIEGRRYVEGGEGGTDRIEIEVLELDALGVLDCSRFVIADDAHAHLLDHRQIVIEGARGAGGGVGDTAGFEMIVERPMAWPAALDDAAQQYRATRLAGGADARCG